MELLNLAEVARVSKDREEWGGKIKKTLKTRNVVKYLLLAVIVMREVWAETVATGS